MKERRLSSIDHVTFCILYVLYGKRVPTSWSSARHEPFTRFKTPQTLPRNLTWHAFTPLSIFQWLSDLSRADWLRAMVDENLPMLITLTCDRLFHLNFEYFDVISMVDKSTEHGKLLLICLTDAFVSPIRTAAECRRLIGHSGPVFSTSFNNDNSFLLSSSADRTGIYYCFVVVVYIFVSFCFQFFKVFLRIMTQARCIY